MSKARYIIENPPKDVLGFDTEFHTAKEILEARGRYLHCSHIEVTDTLTKQKFWLLGCACVAEEQKNIPPDALYLVRKPGGGHALVRMQTPSPVSSRMARRFVEAKPQPKKAIGVTNAT